MQGGAGHVTPAVAPATLARNQWIDVARRDGRFHIHLGKRCIELGMREAP